MGTTILKWLLKNLAVLTFKKYQPGIIGVTGSVGKTSAKEAINAVLRNVRRARASSGNFNNEIGLPLTVLGDWQKVGGKFFWLKVFCVSLLRLIFPFKYPEILILEYAADKPGDIKYLLDIAKPQMAVITAVGDIPVHVEFYGGPDAVAKEKAKLVEALPSMGMAILNFDDEAVLSMQNRTRAHNMTYGFAEGAQLRINNFENRWESGRPVGISFKLEYGESFVPVRMEGCLGKAQAYAAAAGACIGLVFGMNLVRISEALQYYQPPPRRMRILSGIKGTAIIDDSYNASPLSMHAALETLRGVKGNRKIGVLGDMLEIGKYSLEAHEAIGRLAGKILDVLVTVGPRAKFIAESANKAGLAKKHILIFDIADDARPEVQNLLKKGDVVLVKSSRAIGLDKVVDEIRQI